MEVRKHWFTLNVDAVVLLYYSILQQLFSLYLTKIYGESTICKALGNLRSFYI